MVRDPFGFSEASLRTILYFFLNMPSHFLHFCKLEDGTKLPLGRDLDALLDTI